MNDNSLFITFLQSWFFIMSKLGNNLVMDVAFCRTTPRTQVISYTKKNPPRPNQLWRNEHKKNDKNTFYLVSKLHPSCKITIKVINCCSHLHLMLISYLHGCTYSCRVVMLALIALVHFFGKRKMESSLR